MEMDARIFPSLFFFFFKEIAQFLTLDAVDEQSARRLSGATFVGAGPPGETQEKSAFSNILIVSGAH